MICKLQYKNFEPGEFVNEHVAAYDEAVEIIKNFPWEEQREKLVVDLTNPSVTFQSSLGFYLKLALYYNGKFVLHYFEGKHLYTKTFRNLKDSYSLIETFFQNEELDTQVLKKELTPFKNLSVHFLNGNFCYRITLSKVRSFFLESSGINVIVGVSLFVLILTKSFYSAYSPFNLFTILFLLAVIFFIGGGINILFFFNYYRYAKGKIFMASKGADVFYFGDERQPQAFNKKDIVRIIIYKHGTAGSRRNPLTDFQLFKFCFKDFAIVVPSLFIDDFRLRNKFNEVDIEYWAVYLAWINKKVLAACANDD